MENSLQSAGMNIGQAIIGMKNGFMVARSGWNGKNLFVFMQIPSTIPIDIIPKMQSLPQAVKDAFAKRGIPINYSNQMALVDADNNITGWSPSGSDAIAEDWFVFNE